MSKKMVRMSVTVPPEFKDKVDYLSLRLGISRSAVISQVLGDSLDTVCNLVQEVPSDFSGVDTLALRRFRDSSVTYINDAAKELSHLLSGGNNG